MLQISSPERRIQLPQGSYLLGRTLPCHLLIEEITVSGEHCRIWHKPEGWYIKDIGSTNGTLLDGAVLTPDLEYPLPRNARVKLGTVMIELEWNDLPSPPPFSSFPIVLLSRQEETSTINQKTLHTAFSKLYKPDLPKKTSEEFSSRNTRVREIYEEARELANSRLPVALEGETGSGKEILARFIHFQSRRKGSMITLVPTTNDPLQESEFFGYRKGAFTGADHDYPGKIKLAENGTLFLDELSHIPHSLQVRLLRFLENGEIFPLGARHSETVDARLLVASNIPFRQLVKDHTLRQDFSYRLCIHTLSLPPLRDRPEDILPLFCQFFGTSENLPADFAECLLGYSWPGNIRELKAEAQRLNLKVKRADQLAPHHLAPMFNIQYSNENKPSPLADPGRDERERRIISAMLEKCNGNKSLAAEQLQISRRGLYKKMKRLGMDE